MIVKVIDIEFINRIDNTMRYIGCTGNIKSGSNGWILAKDFQDQKEWSIVSVWTESFTYKVCYGNEIEVEFQPGDNCMFGTILLIGNIESYIIDDDGEIYTHKTNDVAIAVRLLQRLNEGCMV